MSLKLKLKRGMPQDVRGVGISHHFGLDEYVLPVMYHSNIGHWTLDTGFYLINKREKRMVPSTTRPISGLQCGTYTRDISFLKGKRARISRITNGWVAQFIDKKLEFGYGWWKFSSSEFKVT